jgi:hypothetical protein
MAGHQNEQHGQPGPSPVNGDGQGRFGHNQTEDENLERAAHDPMRFMHLGELFGGNRRVHGNQFSSSEMRPPGKWQTPARTR